MSTPPTFAEGTFAPNPARGSLLGMLRAQAGIETRLALRNGEQVLLTLLIPVVLLLGLSLIPLLPVPEPRVGSVLPAILALAVMSSAFTSQAIALGFDRRYGVLRRLAATALPRWLLVTGRLVAVLAVVVIQVVLLCVLAALIGWRPSDMAAGAGADLGGAVVAVLLGAAAFGALGILLGGTLRAEIVLALANVVWFVLLLAGGIVIPLSVLPEPIATIASFLPSGALAEALRATMVEGSLPGIGPVLVLLVWAVAAGLIAARTVRWR
ncbi:ABC-2 type transport system permease protein [Pseudonocardia sediminis]|uniref:ABC-2 type transport system permease protein n=1 Tax=Pseudonocardia sediminis TaxID=1397368 RepID=A0A4Q7UWW2_PSEST|nr:ABC transporter permease [Pseudonocardia sediminis]RZT86245.1 ABC-2 type transport system permease protein [Pseudonocardia sediminis]